MNIKLYFELNGEIHDQNIIVMKMFAVIKILCVKQSGNVNIGRQRSSYFLFLSFPIFGRSTAQNIYKDSVFLMV